MLSVKSMLNIGGSGGGDNSLWAEVYSPKRESKFANPYQKSVQLTEPIEMHINYDTVNNQVIPDISLTTTSYGAANPFVKAVIGYTVI